MGKNDTLVYGLGAAMVVAAASIFMRKRSPYVPPDGESNMQIAAVDIQPSGNLGYSSPYTINVHVINLGDVEGSMDVWLGWIMDPTDYEPNPYPIAYSSNNPQTITLAAGEQGVVTRSGTTISGEWWDGWIWALSSWDPAAAHTAADVADAEKAHLSVRP